MEKRKFIIDCDTGTDDAIAIVAGLCSDEIEVRAITTLTGNVSVKYTSQNTLNLVRYIGSKVPVAIGAWNPLKLRTDDRYAEETHGKTGLGGIVLPTAEDSFCKENAIEVIYNEAVKAQGQLEIVAIGPLTNIAIALLLYPQLKTYIKHLWIMGGAITGGNITATAEFNMWCDPEAAKIIFASGIECTMIGLDVTTKAVLGQEDMDRIGALGTKAGEVVSAILKFMIERGKNGGEAPLMHDALAVAAALCPECLKCRKYFVDVECEGEYTFGHTEVDLYQWLGKTPNVSVAEEVDLPLFKEWLYRTIAGNVRY